MATIVQRSGNYCVRIRVKGYKPVTKTFNSKKSAQVWALATEDSIKRGVYIFNDAPPIPNLAEALRRYESDITTLKRGARQERVVINALRATSLIDIELDKITVSAVTKLRDMYLANGLSASTIQKRLALLSHLYTIAISEWHLPLTNPIKSVRKPVINNQRTRRVSDAEFEAVIQSTHSAALKALAMLALETAARLGELVSIEAQEVEIDKRLITFPITKNGSSRVVPLSTRATHLLEKLITQEHGRLFPVTSEAMSRAWARAVSRARQTYIAQGGVEPGFLVDLHFHDLRHERISRLAELGLGTLELSAISGHKSLSMLKRYTHINPELLGQKLAALGAA